MAIEENADELGSFPARASSSASLRASATLDDSPPTPAGSRCAV